MLTSRLCALKLVFWHCVSGACESRKLTSRSRGIRCTSSHLSILSNDPCLQAPEDLSFSYANQRHIGELALSNDAGTVPQEGRSSGGALHLSSIGHVLACTSWNLAVRSDTRNVCRPICGHQHMTCTGSAGHWQHACIPHRRLCCLYYLESESDHLTSDRS